MAKSKKKKETSKPPQPPEVDRNFHIHTFQMIGIPLLLLVPILALFGLFGESVRSVSTSNRQLDMSVEHPVRFRYKMIDEVIVTLSNKSGQTIPTVQVNFDREYIDGFSSVTFVPSVKSISDSDYIVEVTDLQPGQTQVISVTIQAEKYGMHHGTISIGAEDAKDLDVPVDTFTFP